jgi:7-cyano-7-deazaguanine reductase
MDTKKWTYSTDREDIFKRVKGLTFEYSTKEGQPKLLIPVPCNFPGQEDVVHTALEYTSLCPFNSLQPDNARITFTFLPDQWEVELKSLKYYLTSFRMVKIFHEDVTPTLLKELWDLTDPFYLTIYADFNVRGGIHTEARSERVREGWERKNHNPYRKVKGG